MQARVERRHREAAWSAINKDLVPSPRGKAWLDGDRITMVEGSSMHVIDACARALANAEARLLADVKALLGTYELRAHQRGERELEAEFYDARLKISSGCHDGMGGKGDADG